MESNLTPVAEAAAMVGIDRSTARKFLAKHGFKMVAMRGEGSQKVNGLTSGDLAKFLEMRESAGYGGSREIADAVNYVYVIQPDPQMRPDRLKIGISIDINARLSTFRCVAPESAVLRRWKAPASCEGFAHAAALALGRQVGVEVFDVDDVEMLIQVLDDAFTLFAS